ncbi:hypothetical protein [Mycoplasma sp. P36-A1]|uniref:hypothetical protein n=1 Tax=Mycoplasma sp. P36-A1 TaxID=3252900 RepID=UPI003C2F2FC6
MKRNVTYNQFNNKDIFFILILPMIITTLIEYVNVVDIPIIANIAGMILYISGYEFFRSYRTKSTKYDL